jgi:hypothetical protein
MLAALTIVLNLIDGILTLAVVFGGYALEANPLMEAVISRSSVEFMIYKLGLVSFGILLLWRLRHTHLAQAGIVSAVAVYGMLMIHHLKSVELLARLGS